MDLDFTKWSSYALVKFYMYAEALWIGLLNYGPECKWSDELARQNFDPVLRAAEDELRRRGDFDRLQNFLHEACEPLLEIRGQAEDLFNELWPKSGGKVVRLAAYVEDGEQRSE
jgi:hypothetical protein